MANALHITADNFETEVIQARRPVLVDFTATWCGPCQLLAPVIERLAGKYAATATVAKVDVDENQDLAARYGITSVPTVLFFKDGEIVDTVRGYSPETVFSGKLDKLLKG